jgi:hypothetical protein
MSLGAAIRGAACMELDQKAHNNLGVQASRRLGSEKGLGDLASTIFCRELTQSNVPNAHINASRVGQKTLFHSVF